MLLSISVSNFLSFNSAETFSMKAGKPRNFADRIARSANAKILKFKAIYGANASGKSSLVRAFDFVQTAVVEGIPGNSTSDYCRLRDENIGLPSRFEIEVVLGNVLYTYGFEVLLSESRFLREWLLEKTGTKSRMIFSRNIEDGSYGVISYPNSAALNERLRIYIDDIKFDSSVLFLKAMNQNRDALYAGDSKVKVFQTLYRWFRYKLSVNYPNEPMTQYTYFFDSKGGDAAEQLLARFDTGISKVNVCDEPAEKVMTQLPKPLQRSILDNLNEQKLHNQRDGIDDAPAVVVRNHEGRSMYLIELSGEDVSCKTIKFSHTHSSALFTLGEESDGTIRLLDLIEILLSNTKNMVYVIDEVNRCLHPLITKQFVKDFLNLAAERDIQLIATTHEVGLMDLELLRQDEIGFVERRSTDGSSRIFSLEDYGARFDKRIRNAYMKGAYDAIPRISDI